MVYDLIYDNEGNIIDAIIMHSTHGASEGFVKTKINKRTTVDSTTFSSANYLLYHNEKINEDIEDGLNEGSLNLFQISLQHLQK